MVDIIVCPRCQQAFGQKEFYSAKGRRYTYCRTCRNKYQSEYRKVHQYGISDRMYEARLKMQKGGCAICGKPPDARKKLAIDHNHQTGEVRGLLCLNCNHALGLLEDDVRRLKLAIRYLSGTDKNEAQAQAESADRRNFMSGGALAVRDFTEDWEDARAWCKQADEMPYERDAAQQSKPGSKFVRRRAAQVERLVGIFNAKFDLLLSTNMARQYLQSANNSAEEVLEAMEKMQTIIESGKKVSSPASYLLSIVKSERKKRVEAIPEPRYTEEQIKATYDWYLERYGPEEAESMVAGMRESA